MTRLNWGLILGLAFCAAFWTAALGLYFDSITQWPIPPQRLAAMGYET